MIPNTSLPPGTIRAVQYRARSSSGGKDWVVVETNAPQYEGKLYIINGTTSAVAKGGGQKRPVGQPRSSFNDAITAKENSGEGYTFVDEYDASRGWESERRSGKPPQPPPPPPTPPTPPVTKSPRTTTKAATATAEAPILSNTDGEGNSGNWFW